MKILVIEDDNNIRESISELLETKNHTTKLAHNGHEGVILASCERPDLIICDVMMPGIDGYEVLTRIRQIEDLISTPFIFLTAKIQKEDLREGMNLGADDYLTKPFRAEELFKAIDARMERKNMIDKEKINLLEPLWENMIYQGLLGPIQRVIQSSDFFVKYFDEYSKEEIIAYAESVKDIGKNIERAARNIVIKQSIELAKYNHSKKKNLINGSVKNSESHIRNALIEISKMYDRSEDLVFKKLDDVDLHIPLEVFNVVIKELMHNAFQCSKSGEVVGIVAEKNNGYYHITITNQGKFLDGEKMDELGLRPREITRGLGLGLYLVRSLVTLCSGDFKVETDRNNVAVSISIKIAK
jgi:two-component system sensor histidine kinase/response regulator